MIVQIYSLADAGDVRAVVDAGVDHVGFAVDEPGVPAGLSLEEGRRLMELVPEDREVVSLTVREDVDAVLEKVADLPPDVLHLCADTTAISVGEQREIREGLPAGVDLMKAVEVGGGDAVELAERYAPVSDWFILDTATPDVPGVGASGETHDWSVSRDVVEAVDVPVVLAGGLTPENVAEAVREVRPAGVDSYTGTSQSERRKDREAVAAFARNARAAAGGTD